MDNRLKIPIIKVKETGRGVCLWSALDKMIENGMTSEIFQEIFEKYGEKLGSVLSAMMSAF